jgi:hypothetical protein
MPWSTASGTEVSSLLRVPRLRLDETVLVHAVVRRAIERL